MLYALVQGPIEQKIIEDCVRTRRPLPPKIEEAPVLYEGLSLFYIGFHDLTSCRFISDSRQGPIPWLAINEYCKYHDICGEQREDFEWFISHLDAVYLEHVSEKIAKQMKAASKTAPSKKVGRR